LIRRNFPLKITYLRLISTISKSVIVKISSKYKPGKKKMKNHQIMIFLIKIKNKIHLHYFSIIMIHSFYDQILVPIIQVSKRLD